MPLDPRAALRRLHDLRARFGPGIEQEKAALIRALDRRRLPSAEAVEALHETLLFVRAFPDGPSVLEAADTALGGFGRRGDVRRFRDRLAQTGIAGTAMVTSFSYPMARWLAGHRPAARIVWDDWPGMERLDRILRALTFPPELQAAEDETITLRAWIDEMRPSGTGDYAALIGRFEGMRAAPRAREDLYNLLDVWSAWDLDKDDPRSATLARWPVGRVAFQTRPLDTARPDLGEAYRAPITIRRLDRAGGAALVDLARTVLSLRDRELEAFDYADPRDAWIADAGRGLLIGILGVRPEWRVFPEALYGGLMIRNGVPAGYWLASALFGSSEVAYNVSPAFRQGESAWVYGRILATIHRFLDVTDFGVFRYQFGYENEEAIQSGAFWFYQKLGFRPRSREALALMRREETRIRRRKGYRSSPATLRRLAEENIFFQPERSRDDVIGLFPYQNLAHRTTRRLAAAGPEPRERIRLLTREAESLLGVRGRSRWPAAERRAFERWSPVVTSIRGLGRWSAADRRALVRVLRAKGARSERDFVLASNRHRPFRAALRRICLEEEER